MSDLDEALGYPIPDDLDVPAEAPPDSEAADRMLYSLGRLDRQMREIEVLAESRIEAVALWQQEETRKLKVGYAWLEAGVTGWARAVHAADPSRKTIRLPNGEVAIRPRQPRVETQPNLIDFDGLRQARPRWLRERVELDKNAVKQAVVPGVEAEIGPEPPDGYRCHHAADRETGELVQGVYVLVPVDKAVTVTPC